MKTSRSNSCQHAVVMLTAVAALIAAWPATMLAQWPPEEFTNLQILPEDIEPRQLTNMMRGFATGLGVRCEHCHVGEPGQPLSSFDFASDDREAKIKAREMMRMVRAVNSEYLTQLGERSEPPIEVQCATCHHGQSRPQTLQRVLLEAHEKDGLDAVRDKYGELRKIYYGTWTFDFTESQLVGVAQQIAVREKSDDAIAILQLNVEYFPQSGTTHYAIGEQYLIRGDTTAAVSSYRTSLELQPDNRAARRRLSELGGGGGQR